MSILGSSKKHCGSISLIKLKPSCVHRNVCTTTPPLDFTVAKHVDFKSLPAPPAIHNNWDARQEDVTTLNTYFVLQGDIVVSEAEFRYTPERPRLPVSLQSAAQVARCLMFLGGSELIAGSTPHGSVLLLQRDTKASRSIFMEVQSKLRRECGVDIWISQRLETFPEGAALQSLLTEILCSRLLQTGRWLHAGDDAERLFDARLATPLAPLSEDSRQRTHVNCPGFRLRVAAATSLANEKAGKSKTKKLGRRIDATLSVEPFVVRALPLRNAEETSRCVYCLPRLAAPASLVSLQTVDSDVPLCGSVFQKTEDMKEFWMLQHGYVLRDDALARMATGTAALFLDSSRVARSLDEFNSTLSLLQRRPPTDLPRMLLLPRTFCQVGVSLMSPQLEALPSGSKEEQDSDDGSLVALSKFRESAGGAPRVLPPPSLSRRVFAAALEDTLQEKAKQWESPQPETPPDEDGEAVSSTGSQETAHEQIRPREPILETRVLPPPKTYSPSRLAELTAFAAELSPCLPESRASVSSGSFMQQAPSFVPSQSAPPWPAPSSVSAQPAPLPLPHAVATKPSKSLPCKRAKKETAPNKRQKTRKDLEIAKEPTPPAEVAAIAPDEQSVSLSESLSKAIMEAAASTEVRLEEAEPAAATASAGAGVQTLQTPKRLPAPKKPRTNNKQRKRA